MKVSTKSQRYQGIYLVSPAAAYGCYVLLLGAALLKQHAGTTDINFMFLAFWGILIFLTTVILSFFGLIYRDKLNRPLLVINVAVSLAIVVLIISVLLVIHQTQPTSYACSDFVRCIVSQGVSR